MILSDRPKSSRCIGVDLKYFEPVRILLRTTQEVELSNAYSVTHTLKSFSLNENEILVSLIEHEINGHDRRRNLTKRKVVAKRETV